jgi:hypothetical protein
MTYNPIYFSPDVIGGYETDATGMSGYSSPPNINYPGQSPQKTKPKPSKPSKPAFYGNAVSMGQQGISMSNSGSPFATGLNYLGGFTTINPGIVNTTPEETPRPSDRPSDYGKFLNLPAGSKVDRAFRDSDKDGIDDRYQSGPGQPRGGSQSQTASSPASSPLKTLRKPRIRRRAMMARPWLNSLAA